MGNDPTLRKVPCGFFPPGSPMASDAGMGNIPPRPDYDRAKRALQAAGYKGETIALLVPTDLPASKAISDVVADTWRRSGMTVDYQAIDWGTLVQRRASKKPPAEGGWNALCPLPSAVDLFTPATHYLLRGNGEKGLWGWPSSPRLEELRDAWLDAPDLATQKKIATDMQAQAFIDVPYIPLGQIFQPTALRSNIQGHVNGPFALCWSVHRS